MLNFHTHSVYSYKKSIARIEDIAKKAKDQGEKAFCITDFGSVTNFIKSLKIADDEGLQFIPGLEVLIKPDKDADQAFINDEINHFEHELKLKRTTEEMAATFQDKIEKLKNINGVKNHSLILLAKNQNGLKTLYKSYNGETEDKNGDFWNSNENIMNNLEDIIVLSGGNNSEILFYINSGEIEKAEFILSKYKELIGDDYYCQIELSEDKTDAYLELIKLARKYNVPLVASNIVNYIDKEDEDYYHTYRNIINVPEEKVIHNEFIYDEDELREKMLEVYPEDAVYEAFNNIRVIENNCEVVMKDIAPGLEDCFEELKKICMEGWEERRKGTPREQESLDRLKIEFETVKERNFSQYFVKVRNICKKLDDLGILRGPGRGSGCGCEINYLTKIIDIDPLEYGLYFERFLNPQRHGFPDIDLDMASEPMLNSTFSTPLGLKSKNETIQTKKYGILTMQEIYDLIQNGEEVEV